MINFFASFKELVDLREFNGKYRVVGEGDVVLHLQDWEEAERINSFRTIIFSVKSAVKSLYTGGMRHWSILCIVLLVPFIAHAADSSVSFATTPLWLSASRITEGRSVHISTVVMKTGSENVSGTVLFYSDDVAIGSAAFSLLPNAGGTVIDISWTPPNGSHRISAKIVHPKHIVDGKEEVLEISNASTVALMLTVDADANHNGIADVNEPQPSVNASAGNTLIHPRVAGVSTTSVSTSTVTDFLSSVEQSAQSFGSTLFKKTEQFRTAGADYSKKQLAAAEQHTTTTTRNSWSRESTKIMGLKILSFFFDNIYAFYIALIFVVLWLIRKVWRRYSLD